MWQGIIGHDRIVERFRRAVQRQRLASGYLFAGPSGIGKKLFAQRLAKALLCLRCSETQLDPCGRCESCIQAEAGTHPDILQVSKPPDRSYIPLELLIGDKEHRGREGLCYEMSLRPFYRRRKIALIDDADMLNAEGANSLLKTLEEPPPGAVMILISTGASRQLPTIRSRCQVIVFEPLSSEQVREVLLEKQLVESPAEATRLANHCEGSVERAIELSDPKLWEFRRQWSEGLAEAHFDSVEWSGRVSQFVDSAGKEAPPRRARLRHVIGFAAEFFAAMIRQGASPDSNVSVGSLKSDDGDLHWRNTVSAAVRQAKAAFGDRWADVVLRRWDACLEAREALERNANQTTLIEAWLDQLAD